MRQHGAGHLTRHTHAHHTLSGGWWVLIPCNFSFYLIKSTLFRVVFKRTEQNISYENFHTRFPPSFQGDLSQLPWTDRYRISITTTWRGFSTMTTRMSGHGEVRFSISFPSLLCFARGILCVGFCVGVSKRTREEPASKRVRM